MRRFAEFHIYRATHAILEFHIEVGLGGGADYALGNSDCGIFMRIERTFKRTIRNVGKLEVPLVELINELIHLHSP